MARNHHVPFYEDELAGGGACEDIDSIFAVLALEQVTAKNEAYRMEDADEEFEESLAAIRPKAQA